MSRLFDEYVGGGAREIFDGHPARDEDRLRAVRRVQRAPDPAVLDALESQNARLARSPARDAHLAALRNGAAAVVTGQQAGLFLGPLYTIYKAATAIRVARALEAETGRAVVPVFWLQSEDHDVAEIATVRVAGPPGAEAIELALPVDADNRISVEHLALPPEVADRLATLREALVPLPHAGEHVDRLARHYRAGAGWVSSFAGVLAELFAPEGLIFVDPRDAALAPFAAPVHRKALLGAKEISAAMSRRDAALIAAGFDAPVRLRGDSPLSFFHPHGATGPRHRLEPAGDGAYAEVGGSGTHSRDALLRALDADPLSFSTSALLRPILQDVLLPTVAYVGGPGEVAYLAQAAPLYEAFDLPAPLVVPRARFTVVDDATRRVLDRCGLRHEEAAKSEDVLLAKCRVPDPRFPEPADLVKSLLGPLDERLARVTPDLVEAGQGMDRALQKARSTIEETLTRLGTRYERALAHRDEKLVEDVRRVRQSLHPLGEPQERALIMASFAARSGERPFIEAVLAAIHPFEFQPGVLA